MNDRKRFEDFLKNVDLNKYREEYRPIKIVEMDMSKDIQAIALLYKVYWEEKNFVSFDEFYKIYTEEKKENLEEFRTKIRMCKNCFYLGLPARIYRTWASLLTQIHGGYVAEDVFGKGTVQMSEELDRKGADIRVVYKGKPLNYQVKKASFSREVRQAKKSKARIDGEFYNIFYEVPADDIFKKPKKLDGEYKTAYLRFTEDKRLKRLDNGFVIFTNETFEPMKNEIDSSL